jgi:hypothetical protein
MRCNPAVFALRRLAAAACLALVALCGPAFAENAPPQKPDLPPMDAVVGRWTGEGRLGFSEGKFESVKCRVTYLRTEQRGQLKQNIRCASASGNIEVLSELMQSGTTLSGHWKETVRNMEGELSGQLTPAGFRVEIKGADLSANMDIMVRGSRQMVEIQFHNSTLIGLTLMLVKG